MNPTRPEWCALFIQELKRLAKRREGCDVNLACECAGVSRRWAYRYRRSRNGAGFREEWESIVRGRNRT